MKKYNIKYVFMDILHRREFFITLTVSFFVILLPVFFDMLTLYRGDTIYIHPAWFYWGPNGKGFSYSSAEGGMFYGSWAFKIFYFFLLPFLASMAYAYSCYDDSHSETLKILIPRMGRKSYYLSKALAVFFGAFTVVFLPLILEQILLCIAAPFSLPFNFTRSAIIDLDEFSHGAMQGLYLNAPYLFNFIGCLLPAITAGFIGLLSYSFSLFFKKSKFVILTLPGILWIVIPFFLTAIVPSFWTVVPDKLLRFGSDFFPWVIFTLGLFAVNILAIGGKLLFVKDELSC